MLSPLFWCPSVPQLFNKVVFLVSFMGNQGTFTRGYQAVVMDMLFIYHLGYAVICVLGLFAHEFFYSFLVSKRPRTDIFCLLIKLVFLKTFFD
jgi:inositol 1,4,5-triphosphate receptor type 2